MHVCIVCTCMCVCGCEFGQVYMCLHSIIVCGCVWMHIYLFLCLCISVFVCVRVSLCMCSCVSLCVRLRVCASPCVCMCLFVRACVYTWMSFTDILCWPTVYVPNSSTAGESTTISRTSLNTDNRWHNLNTSPDAFREKGIAFLAGIQEELVCLNSGGTTGCCWCLHFHNNCHYCY